MKMRHNKKRNTAFLYESLIKELTKSIVRKEENKKQKIISIIKEFFNSKSILKRELNIYNALLENKHPDDNYNKRLIYEVKKDFNTIDRKKVFNAQTRLIKAINEQISNSVFANFISNYKSIATVGQFLQSDNLDAKKRILIEDKVVKILTLKENKANDLKHIDNLTYKTFIKKFNETYRHTLRQEQKSLLTNYIVSFSDNGLGLKSFLNDEVGRLKEDITDVLKLKRIESNSSYKSNLNKILIKLEDFKKTPVNESMVKEIFYIQDLIHEVKK